uniref:Uncharacterized protein n=1 Tax=Arundo donax TaxID=35708 RepID=A0A0A9D000_ARUDO
MLTSIFTNDKDSSIPNYISGQSFFISITFSLFWCRFIYLYNELEISSFWVRWCH